MQLNFTDIRSVSINIFLIFWISFSIICSSNADILLVADRTPQVRDAIIAAAGVNTAAEVTDTHLAAITTLNLREKEITELKSGDFSGMSGLTNLNLYDNQLSELPDNIFEGLTALASLRLGSNTVDPLPIVVTLEKVGADQVKAVTRTGAPFPFGPPVIVTNGMLATGVEGLQTPLGTTASSPITVSRTTGTTDAVTVDIGTLPSLPRNHYGYVLTKSDTLPIEIIAAVATENRAPMFSDDDETTRTVAENTASGENIGTPIAAMDEDEDTLIYALGGEDADTFDINTSTGQLKTKLELDYEVKTSYSIIVSVSDGSLTDTIAVTIEITDVLDNRPPTFDEGEITVRRIVENSVSSTDIGKSISATDVDEDTLIYSLSGYNASSFEINTSNGQLETKAVLDYEKQRFYVVVVNAADDTYTESITVIIQVLDVDDVTDTPTTLDVSDRTQQVQDAILKILTDADTVDTVDEITDVHLTEIKELNLRDTGITELKRGDFGGLTALENLNLHDNAFYSLPVGIFEGLTALKKLRLGNNPLHPFPIFVSMQKVQDSVYKVIVPSGAPFDIVVPLIVKNGSLSNGETSATIPQGSLNSDTFTLVADMMTDAAATVDIGDLPMLPNDHYGYILTKSTACNRTPQVRDVIIELVTTITDCRHVTEVNLATIAQLNFDEKGIETLNPLDFAGMLSLTSLSLKDNKITELPDDIFTGLYSLKALDLTGNWIIVTDPDEMREGTEEPTVEIVNTETDDMMEEKMKLPLSVSVEIVKLNDTDIKAVVPTGAPFDIVLPLTIPNGMLPDEITELFVHTGEAESQTFTVSRIPDTIGAVTVDFELPGMLPKLHAGYILSKTNKEPLHIINRIEVSPMFNDGESATRSISENVEEGESIGTIVGATDANEDSLTYTLGGDDADKFEINEETGQLITSEPLDFEEEDTYSVTVTVTDGTFTVTIPVTISIEDANDPPQFDESDMTSRSIGEHTAADQNIGSPITALDADNDDLTYSLGGEDASVFDIDTSNGQLKTKEPLNYERKRTYSVVMNVSDTEGATDAIEVNINITDENDAPSFFEGDKATRSIPENTAAGENIGTPIVAMDPDADANLTYTLSGKDAATFAIESSSGQLKTKDSLDFEKVKTYTVEVTVSDTELEDTIEVEIIVTDVEETIVRDDTDSIGTGTGTGTIPVNNPPEFTDEESTSREVAENTAAGENIGSPVSATDADEDDLTYTLSGTHAGSFAIVENSGQLQTSAALDYETQSVYNVTITAFDGALTDTIAVTINVTDVDEIGTPPPVQPPPPQPPPINNAPEFTDGTATSRSVPENTASGENIGSPVSADDADNDDLTYTLSGDHASSFAIVENSGQLQTSAALDYETQSVYNVTITVSDGSLTDTIAVTINVTDVDELGTTPPPVPPPPDPPPTLINNAPEFTDEESTSREVAENTAAGENIGTPVSATDADNDDLTYTLSGTHASSFAIVENSGQLQTSAALDYETQSVYNVTITVSDGSLTDTIAVTIDVININDNPPMFAEETDTTRSVRENIASGTNIGAAVSASDADNDDLTYTLSGDQASSFTIVDDTGQLQTSVSLDYETQSVYNVTIIVTDGTFTDSIAVRISIDNINDNPPEFAEGTDTTRSVPENTPAGMNIGSEVSATDLDGNNVTYTLSGTDANAFSVVGNSGQLQTRAALDYETQSVYNVTIIASDGTFTDSIDVRIDISNVDDIPPMFLDGPTTSRSVDENVDIGTPVGDPITAEHQENQTIIYSLSGNNATDFNINMNDAQISTAVEIDYERTSQYVLIVTAQSTNLRTATIQVTINVNDLNEAVRDAIVDKIPGVTDYDDVTPEQLATIKTLDVSNSDLNELNTEDFEGLTGLKTLDLSINDLDTIPDDFFDELTTVETLRLRHNELTSLPTSLSALTSLTTLTIFSNELTTFPDVIKQLTSLKILNLSGNKIGSLPADAFTDLTSLEQLGLGTMGLTSLPSGIFSTLTSLTQITLAKNNFSSLDAGVFSGLTALTFLNLSSCELTTLPDGIFDPLTALIRLYLNGNEFSSLPSGIFDKLTALTVLDLAENQLNPPSNGLFLGLTALQVLYFLGNSDEGGEEEPVDLSIGFRKTAVGKFKAVVPAGAPFDITVGFRITNGSSSDGASTVTVSQGASESDEITVNRDVNPDDPNDLPSVVVWHNSTGSTTEIPSSHDGYTLVYPTTRGTTVYNENQQMAPTFTIPIPDNTALLANYPNPSNPDTWIPYQLSEPSAVLITIFDIRGRVVRRLDLGHQPAGFYLHRSRAAHWDGQNDLGERVATGVYFYQFRAGSHSQLRKMLIRK